MNYYFSEDDNLLGAILRCHLCHCARVFAVPLSDDVTSLSECWISELVPIVTVNSFDDVSRQPLWSGPCAYVSRPFILHFTGELCCTKINNVIIIIS